MNGVNPNRFETKEDYIEQLKNLNTLSLGRRNLQDLGGHYAKKAKENEDWEAFDKAIHYYDLSINMAGGRADSTMKAVQAILQVLDDEKQKKVDKILKKHQKKAERSARNLADREMARREQEEDDDESRD